MQHFYILTKIIDRKYSKDIFILYILYQFRDEFEIPLFTERGPMNMLISY